MPDGEGGLAGLILAVDDFVKHVDHDLEVVEDVSHRSATALDVWGLHLVTPPQLPSASFDDFPP